ncbi:heterokaryon incompatibility protein-domain-containing protein [Xylariales sp. PMI_506]|nr:heterokaryon incompatibility protein-domain-containing protein [Xylariales sp. PMI_506]
MASFRYQPLDPQLKEIRLLELARGRQDEIIRGRLVCTLLGDPLAYETISYCWGDASLRGAIELDGFIQDVPASTIAALKCMRKDDGVRLVWIDAICINQADLLERSSQVSFMADIYKSSQLNLIYLGEEDDGARRGIECARNIILEIRDKTNDFSEFHNIIQENRLGHGRAARPIDCKIDDAALGSVYSRPWFDLCFCGPDLSIPLVDLLRVAIWLCYHRGFISPWLFDHDGMNNAADLWNTVDNRQSYDEDVEGSQNDLTVLMRLAQWRLASEPRDKVFGILGLLPQLSTEPEDGAPDHRLIIVDYQKSLAQVLCDATRYAIQELSSLAILQSIRHRQVDEDLDVSEFPSWAARIDLQYDEAFDAENIPFNLYRADNSQGTYFYNAQADHIGPKTLSLAGYWVCTVMETSDAFLPEIWNNRDALARLLASVLDMARTGNRAHMSAWGNNDGLDKGFSRMLASTLMAGNVNGVPASDDDELASCSFLNELVNGEDPGEENQAFHNSLASACRNRRFFMGDNGYVGLAPRGMRAGDWGVVLCGGSVPFILRPLSDLDDEDPRYHILGEAYIHGVMDGVVVVTSEEADLEANIYNIV